MRSVYVIGKPLTKLSMLTIWFEPISALSHSEILINTMKEQQIKIVVTDSENRIWHEYLLLLYGLFSQISGER